MIGVFYMFWVSVHGASESRGIELFGQRLLLGHGVGMSGVNLQQVFWNVDPWTLWPTYKTHFFVDFVVKQDPVVSQLQLLCFEVERWHSTLCSRSAFGWIQRIMTKWMFIFSAFLILCLEASEVVSTFAVIKGPHVHPKSPSEQSQEQPSKDPYPKHRETTVVVASCLSSDARRELPFDVSK